MKRARRVCHICDKDIEPRERYKEITISHVYFYSSNEFDHFTVCVDCWSKIASTISDMISDM